MDGAWVRLSSGGASNLTAGGGYYLLVTTQGWSGTVSVLTQTGSFSPAAHSISSLSGDRSGLDFSWSSRFTLSGRVVNYYTGAGVSGVVLTFEGAGVVTSGVSGAYSMPVAYGWSGTATPAASTGTFAAPVSRTYAEVWEDLANQDFQWVPPDPELRGRVTNQQTGAGMAGVSIQIDGYANPIVTGSGGGYTQRVSYGWSGSVAPSIEEGSFSPAIRTYADVVETRTGVDFQWSPPVKMIMGVVTNADTGGGVAGVRVTFSGGIGAVTTDVNGAYAAGVWQGWSGTATASHTNGSFVAVMRTYGAVSGDLLGQNYAWWPPRTIAGRVTNAAGEGVAGVMLRLPGSMGSATTMTDGAYVLSVTQNWSGRVMATNALGGLVPAYRDYPATTGNRTGQDYTWYPKPVISGRVVNQATGQGVLGVTIQFGSAGSTTSGSDGTYSWTVAYGWSGLATATHGLGSFAAPASRTYAGLVADCGDQDYVWIPADPVVSGKVTNRVTGLGVSGVTIQVTGVGEVLTAANGSYAVTVPLGWSGTIGASYSSGEITPASRSVNNLVSNRPGQDFSWTAPDPWVTGRVVCDITGRGVTGVTLSFAGLSGNVTTDGNGAYARQVGYNWSGTVTPALSGWTMDPVGRTYTQVRVSASGQDYVAIPGRVAGDKYVSKTGSSVDPFASWETAATNVAWAVDSA